MPVSRGRRSGGAGRRRGAGGGPRRCRSPGSPVRRVVLVRRRPNHGTRRIADGRAPHQPARCGTPSGAVAGRRASRLRLGRPRPEQLDVYVKEIASGEMVRVTSDAAGDYHPVWRPDGRYLAFLRRQGTGARVILVPAGGGDERELALISELPRLYLQDLWSFWLDWSPDGRFLAVSDRAADGHSWGVYLISVETGEKRALTTTGNPRIIDRFPAFSPDGRTLAFLRGSFAPEAKLLLQPLTSDATPAAPAKTVEGQVLTSTADLCGWRAVESWWLVDGASRWAAHVRGRFDFPEGAIPTPRPAGRRSRSASGGRGSSSAPPKPGCSSSAPRSPEPPGHSRLPSCPRRGARTIRTSRPMAGGSPSRPRAPATASSGSAPSTVPAATRCRVPAAPSMPAARAGRPTGSGPSSTSSGSSRATSCWSRVFGDLRRAGLRGIAPSLLRPRLPKKVFRTRRKSRR